MAASALLAVQRPARRLRRDRGAARHRSDGRAGRDRRRARLQRRRQVDAQPHHFRHRARARAARSGSTAPTSGARSRRRSSRAALSMCRRAGASSPISRCARISISAATGAPRARRAANRERVFSIFPRLLERRAQARRHAVRRRAADARHRPRPDGRAQADHSRRAVARPVAAAGRGAVRADRGASTPMAFRSCWSSRTSCRASKSPTAPISSPRANS